jgi:hypothetical protein
MDLSSYISFLVQADVTNISAPVFKLTDNSVYPVGVVPTGIFTITQPDGITRTGTFTSPDISGGTLIASIALRLTSANLLQQGEYTIKYEVSADGYVPTLLSRSFTIGYTKPTVVLTKNFDVFTPALSYDDSTVYTAGSFTQTVVRTWQAVMSAATITGTNSASFDLKYAGSYYDSAYAITFTATITYQSTSYSYLSIVDYLESVFNVDVYTPPTSAQLLTDMTTLKTRLDALINSCQKYDNAKADYEYAYTLYAHAQKRICASDSGGVDTYIQEIIDILNNNVTLSRTHTNAPISAYVYDCGSTPAPVVPYVLEVVAGTSAAISAGIVVGATTFVNSLIANKYVNVYRGGIKVPGIDPLDGGEFLTKTYLSNTITFSTPIQDSELISINTI